MCNKIECFCKLELIFLLAPAYREVAEAVTTGAKGGSRSFQCHVSIFVALNLERGAHLTESLRND